MKKQWSINIFALILLCLLQSGCGMRPGVGKVGNFLIDLLFGHKRARLYRTNNEAGTLPFRLGIRTVKVQEQYLVKDGINVTVASALLGSNIQQVNLAFDEYLKNEEILNSNPSTLNPNVRIGYLSQDLAQKVKQGVIPTEADIKVQMVNMQVQATNNNMKEFVVRPFAGTVFEPGRRYYVFIDRSLSNFQNVLPAASRNYDSKAYFFYNYYAFDTEPVRLTQLDVGGNNLVNAASTSGGVSTGNNSNVLAENAGSIRLGLNEPFHKNILGSGSNENKIIRIAYTSLTPEQLQEKLRQGFNVTDLQWTFLRGNLVVDPTEPTNGKKFILNLPQLPPRGETLFIFFDGSGDGFSSYDNRDPKTLFNYPYYNVKTTPLAITEIQINGCRIGSGLPACAPSSLQAAKVTVAEAVVTFNQNVADDEIVAATASKTNKTLRIAQLQSEQILRQLLSGEMEEGQISLEESLNLQVLSTSVARHATRANSFIVRFVATPEAKIDYAQRYYVFLDGKSLNFSLLGAGPVASQSKNFLAFYDSKLKFDTPKIKMEKMVVGTHTFNAPTSSPLSIDEQLENDELLAMNASGDFHSGPRMDDINHLQVTLDQKLLDNPINCLSSEYSSYGCATAQTQNGAKFYELRKVLLLAHTDIEDTINNFKAGLILQIDDQDVRIKELKGIFKDVTSSTAGVSGDKMVLQFVPHPSSHFLSYTKHYFFLDSSGHGFPLATARTVTSGGQNQYQWNLSLLVYQRNGQFAFTTQVDGIPQSIRQKPEYQVVPCQRLQQARVESNVMYYVMDKDENGVQDENAFYGLVYDTFPPRYTRLNFNTYYFFNNQNCVISFQEVNSHDASFNDWEYTR